MNTKLILAAVSIAVLSSPVMAQPESHHAPAPASIARAHGSAHPASRLAPMETNNHIQVDDCVRVAFPQCSGGN